MKTKTYFLPRFKILTLLFIFGVCLSLKAQNPFCNFDQVLANQINSDLKGIMIENELLMQQEMQDNPQAIMNSVVYVVPVVFHVIHLGESQGTGSNIPTSAIDATIQQLNDHYRDVLDVGYDVEIEFCLAQRAPDGSNHSGINRVNGSSISSYASFGINSANEAQVKALSIWPNGDCINIWSVHNIQSPQGGEILGYATFPGAPASIDGIVMKSWVVGSTSQSGVITHEMGHFFDLYHTFQGSNNFSTCPPIDDCEVDGDKVCDTRAHSYMNQSGNWFPCDESQYTSCEPSYSEPFLVVENHMNYTTNSCRDEFTPDQAMRMRCALMTLRPQLLNSLCCHPGCISAIADFTYTTLNIDIGESITFTNTSTGAITTNWTVEGNTYDDIINLTYQFNNFGTYDVCLTVENLDCINQKCVTVEVSCEGLPPCNVEVDCDNLIKNGDFSLNCVGENSSDVVDGAVCNWQRKFFTPRFCTDINGADAMVLAEWDEAIVTKEPVPLNAGELYKLTFEYYRVSNHTAFEPTILSFGFDANPTTIEAFPFDNFELLNTIENSNYDQIGFYTKCFGLDEVPFHQYEYKFKFSGELPPHLFFSFNGDTNHNFIQIRNVSIECCDVDTGCNPQPQMAYDSDCPKEFNGFNTGDGDDYAWTFSCTETTHYGPNVTLDLPPGECEVCLTIFCDLETSETICETITIPEPSEDCEPICQDLTVELETCKQNATSETTFIADFSIKVPDGTQACDGLDVISGSTQFETSSTISFEDDPNDPSLDIVNVSITFITPPGTDILNNPIAGLINLCDPDGNIICYNLTCVASECTNCLGEIKATASCADPNPFDDEYVYEGSVIIDLPNDGFIACDSDPVSSEVGFEPTITMNGLGNQASIDFSIITTSEGDFDASSLLCFYNVGLDMQVCITLNIEIDPCPEPPVCIDWGNKVTNAKNCTVTDDGQVTYTVDMSNEWLFGTGYSDCGHGLSAILDGSDEISLNGGSILNNGGFLNYSAFITMPCGFDTGQTYELIIVACDRDGNPACFSFNIRFPDCDVDCRDDRGEGPKRRSIVNNLGNTVTMYPNPAAQDVYISIINADTERNSVQIIDQLGQIITDIDFDNEVRIDVSKLHSGVHFVRIIDSNGNLLSFEKLIILK